MATKETTEKPKEPNSRINPDALYGNYDNAARKRADYDADLRDAITRRNMNLPPRGEEMQSTSNITNITGIKAGSLAAILGAVILGMLGSGILAFLFTLPDTTSSNPSTVIEQPDDPAMQPKKFRIIVRNKDGVIYDDEAK